MSAPAPLLSHLRKKAIASYINVDFGFISAQLAVPLCPPLFSSASCSPRLSFVLPPPPLRPFSPPSFDLLSCLAFTISDSSGPHSSFPDLRSRSRPPYCLAVPSPLVASKLTALSIVAPVLLWPFANAPPAPARVILSALRARLLSTASLFYGSLIHAQSTPLKAAGCLLV
ncbi:hypothetical protein FQN51_005436 [Onygenales sp. PD_10]|nr:hypothetical protein FQN51_005436 [Onygenales sp. PD_10]